MKVYKATHFQYVMVHTDLGFFKINNLGTILEWEESAQNWVEAKLTIEDAAQLVVLSLAKFNKNHSDL